MTAEQATAKESVTKFLAEQTAKGVKRAEQARSLFNRGFSEVQVALVMGVHPKTAHAFKKKFIKGDETKKFEVLEIKNFLKVHGGAVGLNGFFHDVKVLVGAPAHKKSTSTKSAEVTA